MLGRGLRQRGAAAGLRKRLTSGRGLKHSLGKGILQGLAIHLQTQRHQFQAGTIAPLRGGSSRIEPTLQTGPDRLDLQRVGLTGQPGTTLEPEQPLRRNLRPQPLLKSGTIHCSLQLNHGRAHRHMAVVVMVVVVMVVAVLVVVVVVVVVLNGSVSSVVIGMMVRSGVRPGLNRGLRPLQAQQHCSRHRATHHRQHADRKSVV